MFKNYKKYANAHSVKEYFNLPKCEREYRGWYLLPFALPSSFFLMANEEKGETWESFNKQIRKEYPIQSWIRQVPLEIVDSFFYRIKMKINRAYHNVRRFFKPCHPRLYKACPRWQYADISELMVDVNFALIQDFWHEEVVDGFVDWQSDEVHDKFYKWLKNAIKYIEKERPRLQRLSDKELDKASRKRRKNSSYEETYGEYDKLCETIEMLDTDVLKKFAENRAAFWT
jgi:hypothetical protein